LPLLTAPTDTPLLTAPTDTPLLTAPTGIAFAAQITFIFSPKTGKLSATQS